MSNYNHVTLIGNLKENPVLTYTAKKATCKFIVGVERYTGKDKPADIDYFNIVSHGKMAEVCGEHLKADKKVLIDGKIQVRSYIGEDKKRHWITEVIAENLKFLSNPSK